MIESQTITERALSHELHLLLLLFHHHYHCSPKSMVTSKREFESPSTHLSNTIDEPCEQKHTALKLCCTVSNI